MPKKKKSQKPFFMGLSKSQTQSFAVGSIIVGLGLFALASVTLKNKTQLETNMFPTASAPTVVAPTLTKMISATSTARMVEKTPVIKQLSNTSSKVTYTVEKNDNLAKIGEKLCDSDRAWLSIIATNKLLYPYTIYPGETYIITCN